MWDGLDIYVKLCGFFGLVAIEHQTACLIVHRPGDVFRRHFVKQHLQRLGCGYGLQAYGVGLAKLHPAHRTEGVCPVEVHLAQAVVVGTAQGCAVGVGVLLGHGTVARAGYLGDFVEVYAVGAAFDGEVGVLGFGSCGPEEVGVAVSGGVAVKESREMGRTWLALT